jgi:predicted amidohydrolase YtcJ
MHKFMPQLLLALWLILAPALQAAELVVYTAKKVITMEPALPVATAVAVENGIVVAVGNPAQLEPLRQARGGRVDRTLEQHILMPGFIDPHVHPSLPAVLTQFPFLAPDDWSLPTGEFPGAKTPAAFKARLTELVAAHKDDKIPFIAWGYHPLWHDEIHRQQLNEWFPQQPVMLWHRSFHEVIGNDAAFELLGISAADVGDHHETDWDRGRFWENGMLLLLPKMPFLFAPDRYGQGMANFLEMMHQSGVTTVLDMGTGIFGDPTGEIALVRKTAEGMSAPSRIVMTPIITDFLARGKTPAQALQEIESWREQDSPRVTVGRHFKLMMDGAIFSGLSQMGPPGYLDGHQGQWMAPLEVTTEWARFFWQQGYQIHAHTNGDLSASALIDMVRELQTEHPRPDHRTALEHFAYTTEDQNRQMAALGMVVSANPYYHYLLSDIYAQQWLGPDRGAQMVRLGSLERLGVPFGLHSDCPMAPLSPLTLAAAAVQRVTINGNLNAPAERVSPDAALRAITIDAAWIMREEDSIGSIRAGKRADFTVLEQDPYKVKPGKWQDIGIWGTVFQGELHPVAR